VCERERACLAKNRVCFLSAAPLLVFVDLRKSRSFLLPACSSHPTVSFYSRISFIHLFVTGFLRLVSQESRNSFCCLFDPRCDAWTQAKTRGQKGRNDPLRFCSSDFFFSCDEECLHTSFRLLEKSTLGKHVYHYLSSFLLSLYLRAVLSPNRPTETSHPAYNQDAGRTGGRRFAEQTDRQRQSVGMQEDRERRKNERMKGKHSSSSLFFSVLHLRSAWLATCSSRIAFVVFCKESGQIGGEKIPADSARFLPFSLSSSETEGERADSLLSSFQIND